MMNNIKNNKNSAPDTVKNSKLPTFIFILNSTLSTICIFVGYLAADHYARLYDGYNERYMFVIIAIFMISFAILYNHYLYLQSK